MANKYCCTETHYPTAVIWGFLEGQDHAGPSSPCAQREACKHFVFPVTSPLEIAAMKRTFRVRLAEILAKVEEAGKSFGAS